MKQVLIQASVIPNKTENSMVDPSRRECCDNAAAARNIAQRIIYRLCRVLNANSPIGCQIIYLAASAERKRSSIHVLVGLYECRQRAVA
jgi:hypothetical protein